MTDAAVLTAPAWTAATVADVEREMSRAHRIGIVVPGWPGSIAGQHVDLRATLPDGTVEKRSYSLASVGPGERIELLVDRSSTGMVSVWLNEGAAPGDEVEVLGPLGRWFVWEPGSGRRTLLIAGGSGVVPMIAMLRAREAAASDDPMRLVYSVRDEGEVLYRDVLERALATGVEVDVVHTRSGPAGRPVGRLSRDRLEAVAHATADRPAIYVCGRTGFVETMVGWLAELGHADDDVRSQRFGDG